MVLTSQRITLVKVWIIILRVVDNPWKNKWGTRDFFFFVYLLGKQESVRLGMYNLCTNEGGTMS